jgi:hypothetical protein
VIDSILGLPAPAAGRFRQSTALCVALRWVGLPGQTIGNVDEALLRNAIELVRPGDVVWDIGANVGLFSFAAAAPAGSAGKIVSFEADVWLAVLLRRSR